VRVVHSDTQAQQNALAEQQSLGAQSGG
jgi:hypothetical protein